MLKILKFNLVILALIFVACPKETTDTKDQQIKQPSSKIIFCSKRDGSNQIYTMNLDGSNQTRISKSSESKYWPRVSPDGKYIVYTNEKYELYLCNIDSSYLEPISDPKEKCFTPSWSPDSSKIVFSSTRGGNKDNRGNRAEDIWLYNLDDSSTIQLTNTKYSDMTPCFSPDGEKIVFTSERDKIHFSVIDNNYISYRRQIYIMNADGSDQKRLTALNPALYYDAPVFSPNGKKIAYTVESLMSPENKWSHIYIMNIDGSHPVRISKINDIHEHPYWSQDGKEIIFDATINRINVIMIMNNDGSNIRMITDATVDNFTASFFSIL